MRSGVDVNVSYAARTSAAVAISLTILLGSLVMLVAQLLDPGPAAGAATAAPPRCETTLAGSLTCAHPMENSGVNLWWKTGAAGTYTVTVRQPSPQSPILSLQVGKVGGLSIGFNGGAQGHDTSLTLALAAGEYTLNIANLLPTPAGVGVPFTLVIAKKGETTPAPSATSASSSFSLGLLAFPVLGLVFLIIPVVLMGEKARIPRRLDPSCVTMRSGLELPWSEYQGLRVLNERQRSGRSVEVGVELTFARGRALIRYRPITNMHEVGPIVAELKARRNPWAS